MLYPTPPPAYTRRIQRLLALINEIKTHPHQEPRLLCMALGVSRAMLYNMPMRSTHQADGRILMGRVSGSTCHTVNPSALMWHITLVVVPVCAF